MKRYLQLFKEAFQEFGDDKAQRLAASLAYYTIFSIAPLLLMSVAIAGLVFGKSQAQAQIVAQLKTLFGASGGQAIEDMLSNAAKPKSGTLAIIIGFATLAFGAAGVFGQLKDAMNTIWNVDVSNKAGLMTMVRQRFLSFAMVLGVGFLLLVSLVIDAAISAMGKFAGDRLPGGAAVWETLQLIVSFAVVTVLFAMIFRFLPDVRVEWRDVWFGAFFTGVLFILGKVGLGLWLGRGTAGSAYGAAGSLVVLLLWIYWSANIVFFGAEFTQVYARHRTPGAQRAANSERPQAVPPSSAPPLAARRSPDAGRGGAGKLVAGGALGLVAGALVGGISATILFVKSLKKLFT